MFGRYSFLQVSLGAPGAYGAVAGGNQFPNPNFAGASSLRNQSLAYGATYLINNNWVADFRFGFFRYRVFVNPDGLGTSPAKDAGIPGLNPITLTPRGCLLSPSISWEALRLSSGILCKLTNAIARSTSRKTSSNGLET